MYILYIKQHDGINLIKSERIEILTRENEPYAIDLSTLTTFLYIFNPRCTVPEHWLSETWIPIKRIDII